MPRNLRTWVSDALALALGFALATGSTVVLAAARRGDAAMTAPSVWLLSPGSGQSVSGAVTVSATASQDTETLQFLLNGANLGPAITSGACSMNWNTAAAGDGNYTVSVVAFDSNGNSTTSAPASVLVENSTAQISSVATSGITTNSATITWTTNQMSSSGVDYGLAGYTNSTPLDVTLTTLHAEALVGLSAGTTYHFRVSSWNGVGLLATSTDFAFTTASNTSVGIPSSPAGSPVSGSSGSSTTASTTSSGTAGSTASPGPAPGACTTPDPFTAMGGGTCYNGGWYPPGFGAPAAPASAAPAPAAPASTAPATNVSAAAGGCTTPDPFVAIGGGTCFNGGWLPSTVAAAVTAAPAPAVTTHALPTTTAPAGVYGGCATSDPFVAMGGGTCFNGGWFPPGMLPAPGTVTATTSASRPAAPAAPATSTGCTTPDPFSSIPGLRGVCSNGGWYPVPRSGGGL